MSRASFTSEFLKACGHAALAAAAALATVAISAGIVYGLKDFIGLFGACLVGFLATTLPWIAFCVHMSRRAGSG